MPWQYRNSSQHAGYDALSNSIPSGDSEFYKIDRKHYKMFEEIMNTNNLRKV